MHPRAKLVIAIAAALSALASSAPAQDLPRKSPSWPRTAARCCLDAPILGDVNCDGALDAFDIEPFLGLLFL